MFFNAEGPGVQEWLSLVTLIEVANFSCKKKVSQLSRCVSGRPHKIYIGFGGQQQDREERGDEENNKEGWKDSFDSTSIKMGKTKGMAEVLAKNYVCYQKS